MIDQRLAAILIFLATAASGLAQQMSSANPELILKELERVEKQRETALASGVAQAYATLSKAASSNESALKLYEDAVRGIRFAGLGRESQEFRDWRTGEGSALGNARSQTAIRFHLQFMGYALRRAAGEELETLAPEVLRYVAALQQEMDNIVSTPSLERAIERREDNPGQARRLREAKRERDFAAKLLTEGVSGSVVAKYLMIEGELARAKDWPASAGDVDAIYDTVILPEFRRTKDPRLIGYWDDKIRRAAEKAKEMGTEYERTMFLRVRQPQLLWKRAEDLALLGDTNKANMEKLSIIRSNPMHPNAPEWIESLRAAVRQGGKAPSTGDTPAPADGASDEL